MRQPKVAQRYAKALFDLALERGELERVKQDADTVRGMKNEDLRAMFMSPVITGEKKTQVFDAIFTGQISELTRSFVNLLFNKGREIATDQIFDAFDDLYRKHNRIEVLEITTATPVTPEINEYIKTKMLRIERWKESKMQIVNKVDENIIGGFVLQIGDQFYDASIRHDLDVIKKQFVENMYVQKLR